MIGVNKSWNISCKFQAYLYKKKIFNFQHLCPVNYIEIYVVKVILLEKIQLVAQDHYLYNFK